MFRPLFHSCCNHYSCLFESINKCCVGARLGRAHAVFPHMSTIASLRLLFTNIPSLFFFLTLSVLQWWQRRHWTHASIVCRWVECRDLTNYCVCISSFISNLSPPFYHSALVKYSAIVFLFSFLRSSLDLLTFTDTQFSCGFQSSNIVVLLWFWYIIQYMQFSAVITEVS